MQRRSTEYQTKAPRTIKIAVIDTGVDRTHENIAGHILSSDFPNEVTATSQITQQITKWRGFPETLDPLEDCDGRGTAITSIILRASPAVTLYIARIFNEEQQISKYEEIVKGLSKNRGIIS